MAHFSFVVNRAERKLRMKKIKPLFQWIAATLIAFILANLLCLIYERPTGWFETPNGPSPAGWRPGSVIVHGTEGYGITKVDENGYLNPSGKLNESYILMMGSSHTQGKELASNKKYSVLVNDHFSKDPDELYTYNIASDGNYLPTLIKHFHAALQAFPTPGAITIEISNTDFSTTEIENAMLQVEYDEDDNILNQSNNAGIKTRAINFIKESCPLLSLAKKKFEALTAADTIVTDSSIDMEPYYDLLFDALSLIRSEYDGPIVFIYHPGTLLLEDGKMEIIYGDTWPFFQQACKENNIDIIDMGPCFEREYIENQKLPYGFSNTSPNAGHLNQTGHKLIAEAVISYVEELV